MIKLFKIVGVGPAWPTNWVIGQFADKQHALDQYNSEVRRARSEGIDDGRPELEFIEDRREVEYFLAEEEVTHTPEMRDEAFETARWGLARK
jgi:predicted metal-dependent HD superfamily phosphohydrolase